MEFWLIACAWMASMWGWALCSGGQLDLLARFEQDASELDDFIHDAVPKTPQSVSLVGTRMGSALPPITHAGGMNETTPDVSEILLFDECAFNAHTDSAEEGVSEPHRCGKDVDIPASGWMSLSTMRSGERQPAVAMIGRERGLTVPEKLVCLDELVANPEMILSLFTLRVMKAIPSIRLSAAIRYRRLLRDRRRVPVWLHNFLLTQESVPRIEFSKVVTAAAIEASSLELRVPVPTLTAVADWLEFAIHPLRDHRGPRDEIVRINTKSKQAQLSTQQFRALLMNERAEALRLLANRGAPIFAPIAGTGARKRQRITSDSDEAPTTTCFKGALTVGQKRACLEDMIAYPDAPPAEFLHRVVRVVPTASTPSLQSYRKNLLSRARLPLDMHRILLDHVSRCSEDLELIADECRAVSDGKATLNMHTIVRTLREWKEFCIRPLLAHNGPTEDIVQAPSKKSKGENVRLSDRQLRVFLRSELAKPSDTDEPNHPGGVSHIATTTSVPDSVEVPHSTVAAAALRLHEAPSHAVAQ